MMETRSGEGDGDPALGESFGRYRIVRRLGAGGMGVVYAARDTELDRDVALKVVRASADAGLIEERLRREARAMARLSHPNVVPVFDIAAHDERICISMELVAGGTLRTWIAARRPWRDVVRLFARAARGLDAAHAAGLVHRDFKPDNVMVGAGDEPRITDFGLAREHLDDDDPDADADASRDTGARLETLTETGALAGTPAYMAPERIAGRPSGPAADQFSFCVAMFEALHGARPFAPSGTSPNLLLAEIMAQRIAWPASRRKVPRWLDAAIARGLEVDPARRWPSMGALGAVLERGLGRRRRIAVALGVAGVAIAAATAAAIALRPAAEPKDLSCLEAVKRGDNGIAVDVCGAVYRRTRDPADGARYAEALRLTGETDALRVAAAITRELLMTPAAGDAWYTLGKLAVTGDRLDEAAAAFELAMRHHRGHGNYRGAGRDGLALGEVALRRDELDRAERILERALADSRHAADPMTEGYCHLALARVELARGAPKAALRALDAAAPHLTRGAERATLRLERGNALQDLGDDTGALVAFTEALAARPALKQTLSLQLNLAYSLVQTGQIDRAADALREADALDPDRRKLLDRLELGARIAAARGATTEAIGLAERALAETRPTALEARFARTLLRAELAAAAGAPADLATWADRAAGLAAAMPPPREPGARIAHEHRAAHELAFAAVAARADAAAARTVLDRWRRSSEAAAIVRDPGHRPSSISSAVAPVLIAARGEVWRLTSDDVSPLTLAPLFAIAAAFHTPR